MPSSSAIDPPWTGTWDGVLDEVKLWNRTTGNVGIGTMEPGDKLSVEGTISTNNGALIMRDVGSNKVWLSVNGDSYLNGGAVGIGTTNPGARLGVGDGTTSEQAVHINAGTDAVLRFLRGGVIEWGFLENFPDSGKFSLYDYDATGGAGYRVTVDQAGTVGIGITTPDATNGTKLHVAGGIRVDGNIAAKYQDVAEWVPAPAPLSAGTVVVLDPEHSNQVRPSSQAYDTKVAGVISDMPGVLLGEGGAGKVKVATTGRVKVKVDASARPVAVGDLLVTSSQEGVAMRSVPLDLGGTPIHRPGTLIGKALEPLKDGQGEILVLLSLQ